MFTFPKSVYEFYLPIFLVFEQQSLFEVRQNVEIRRLVLSSCARVPVVKRQIRGLGQQSFFSFEIRLEGFGPKTMSPIDVPAYLLALGILVTNKNYHTQLALPNQLLTSSLGRIFSSRVTQGYKNCLSQK